MAEPRHWHLFMYDVTDPKALRKVHDLLVAWGQPMQYSVFRVRCSARELEKLRFELTGLLAPDDRLTIVRLCDNCAGRISSRGKELAPFDLEPPAFRLL